MLGINVVIIIIIIAAYYHPVMAHGHSQSSQSRHTAKLIVVSGTVQQQQLWRVNANTINFRSDLG